MPAAGLFYLIDKRNNARVAIGVRVVPALNGALWKLWTFFWSTGPELTSSSIRNRISSHPPHPHPAVANFGLPFPTSQLNDHHTSYQHIITNPKCPLQRPTSSISTAPSSANFLPDPSSPPRARPSTSASATSSLLRRPPSPPALPRPSTSPPLPKPSSFLPTSKRSANTLPSWNATTPA